MADRMLFVCWGETVRGAEERGIEVFNEALGLLGRMQQDGKIEKFDVALLTPNGELGGFISAQGSAEQVAALREDPEWQRNTIEASLIVDDLRHIDGYTNEGVASQMALYQEVVGRVPQRT